ncbi:MAG: hypothetical protein M3440_12330 [Chloroflexota bacterium]|nr:hypothetical protein [Chloroflexota bacterium]
MPQILESLWRQVRISISLFRFGAVRLVGITAFLITVLAIFLAPGASPTGWDWTRMLLILGTATVAMVCFLASRDTEPSSGSQQQRLFVAAFLVTCSLLLNITFGLGTAITFSLGFTLVALLARLDSRGRSPWLLCSPLGVIIPFWIWTAFDAWHVGLLLLVPLGVIALVSDGHIRDAVVDEAAASQTPAAISSRAHRLASWLGILASAVLILIAGLPGNNSSSWLVMGAIGAVIGVALQAGLPRMQRMSTMRRSILLCDAALAWIAVCWLASL